MPAIRSLLTPLFEVSILENTKPYEKNIKHCNKTKKIKSQLNKATSILVRFITIYK